MQRTLAGILAATLLSAGAQAQTTGDCDRTCLKGFLDGYLTALVARDPGRLPLAPTVRFTEDAAELRLGEGLWRNATKLRSYRQDIIDPQTQTATTHVVVEEGAAPVMLSVRLKVEDQKITEIETMVVRNKQEGMIFEIEALTAATAEMNRPVPPAQRNTRTEMIEIAERYPKGLKVGSFVTSDVPFAPTAYRFENGRRMAGPGCDFQPPTCENMKVQKIPTLAGITHRVTAVDEELGVVLLRMDFGPGSTFSGGPDVSVSVWEWFKIYNGQVHAVEAFMETKPAADGMGWD